MLLACCLLLAASPLASGSRPPDEVRTSLGPVRGRRLTSRDGRDYLAFTALPYAQPPLASLRFKPPLPAKPWPGVLDGTRESPKCPQYPDDRVIGQEDCLTLDVFTPNVSGSLPVLVHIHGGSFLIGPEPMEAGPEMAAFFMDQDVVLATVRYRLGILGFLSDESSDLPGNMGLKDMALSLEWLEKEVHAFGGNPRSMTVFGISAGGASTHYLCLAPRTRKLLKGCISGSGVAGSAWSLNKKGKAKAVAKEMAKKFSCPENQLASCLRGKSIQEIILPYADTLQTGFQPSIEPASSDAMVTEWPPSDTNFPWVLGHTANEGILTTGFIANFDNETGLKPYLEDWETHLPRLLRLEKDKRGKAKKVHDRFFVNQDPYTAVERFITEGWFVYPALKEALRHSGPKYFYRFNYAGGPSLWEIIAGKELNITGVGHCDETPYLFNIPNGYKPEGWPSKKDVALSRTLIDSWVTFARTQSPSLGRKLPWKELVNNQYLEIANSGNRMKLYPSVNEIIQFWDSIME